MPGRRFCLPAVAMVALLVGCSVDAAQPVNNSAPTPIATSTAPSPTSTATPAATPTATPRSTSSANTPPRPRPRATVSEEEANQRGQQLVRAARAGDADLVDRLLDTGASVTARDDSGATALVAAAYGNHLAVARRLLEAGADPNAKDETVQSAYLISTSEVGDDPRLLRLTLASGGDVASLDSWRGTGLIRAADRGFYRIVAVLLDTDIDLDHVNRIGYTALHEAVVLGDGGATHVKTVAALVRAGADTSIEDSRGRTALQSARELGYDEIADLLD